MCYFRIKNCVHPKLTAESLQGGSEQACDNEIDDSFPSYDCRYHRVSSIFHIGLVQYSVTVWKIAKLHHVSTTRFYVLTSWLDVSYKFWLTSNNFY